MTEQVTPQTVEEAKALLAKLEAERRQKEFAELEQARAQLFLESHAGTIAHIKHVIRILPDKIELEKIRAEREVGKAVGSEVRTIVLDLKDILLGPSKKEAKKQ